MGIPGVLKEIGKGERVALSKLAIDHLKQTNRPLRIAIDAAIWNFQNQAGQGGKNPALRTLFFRLLKILALPIDPVFVYDGKNKPLTKRGKTVSRYGTCIENETAKQLLSQFRFPYHVAPGEAEAECAFLQKKGIVDAVMSQDVDAIMFGSTLTLRDWSKEGTRGNKTPTHVNVLDLPRIKQVSGLDPDGMILIALLSGGDYNEAGVPGFGAALSCEIAKAGFGADLLELVKSNDKEGLRDWRERLEYELQTNESGYFRRRHGKLKVPEDFPDTTILGYYLRPAISKDEDLITLEARWTKEWMSKIDVQALRQYTALTFDWNWKSGARRFVRCTAQPLLQHRLLRGTVCSSAFSSNDVSEERRHFTNDGIVELRLRVVPADMVEIDIEAEQENPEYAEQEQEEDSDTDEACDSPAASEDHIVPRPGPSKQRRAPWSPYLAEKWWVPQTLLQFGLPAIVEDWQQLQRDIQMDPRKFATRKCSKVPQTKKPVKVAGAQVGSGPLRAFLTKQPDDNRQAQEKANINVWRTLVGSERPRTSAPVAEGLPPITQFFKSQKTFVSSLECQKPFRAPTPVSDEDIEITAVYERSCPSTTRPAEPNLQCHKLSKEPYVDNNHSESSKDSRFCTISTINHPETLTIEVSTTILEEASSIEVTLDNVTRRRRRGPKLVLDEAPDRRQHSTLPKRRPMESFFGPSLDSDITCISSKSHKLIGMKSMKPAFDSSECLAAPIHPTHMTATSRDSLPGTWREAKVEVAPQRRRPRVSYVDLTGD